MGLLAELRRRRLFRVAALYIVGTWMVLQVFDLLFPRLHIPDAVMDIAFIGALMGFPIALVFGWIYDITPRGIVRTRPSRPGEEYPDLSLKRSDYLILGALLAVVAAIVYNLAIEVSEIPPEGEGSLAMPNAPENSIAVLPFANMSSDPDNEFFCDGISEEILNKLSAIGELHVIARTSSFALKDSGYDIPKIAAILGVRYLLQGSVRRDGRQLRISTQLLDRSGQQLWNTTFDRELEGIFAIQRDIADSVAVTITPRIVTQADSGHVPVIEAWEHYLLGHEMYVKRLPGYQWNAAEQFRKAIELDPEFADPYAELATVLILGARWGDDDYRETYKRAEDAIDAALALDPNQARAYAARGLLLSMREPEDYARASVALRRALDLDPNLVNAYNWLAGALSALGREDESMAQYELAIRIDPLAPVINVNLSLNDLQRGRTAQAEKRLLRVLQVPRPSHLPYASLADMYLLTGRLVDWNKISRELALVFARENGRGWLRHLAQSFVFLGMWQQAEYWYDYTERQFEELYQVRFARLFLLRRQGRFEEMNQVCDRILDSRQMTYRDLPTQFAMVVGIAKTMAGDYTGAIGILGQTLDLKSPGEGGLENSYAHGAIQAYAWALLMTGDTDIAGEVLALLEEHYRVEKSQGLLHRSDTRFFFAQNALLRGEFEATLNRLQRAVDAGWRDYYLLLHDPRWDPIRDDPRFQAIMEAVRDDVEAQRAEVEILDAEDDFPGRIDAVVAEFEARSGDD